MSKASKIVTIKIASETKNKLEYLGKLKSRSPHWLMKKAINTYIEEEEYKEKLRQETLTRLKEIELGQVVSHSRVKKWLESWGTKEEKSRP